MNILVIGSGGREHAISWKLSKSSKIKNIFVSPGNYGTSITDKCKNIDLKNKEEILKFAIDSNIDITIVGPELPLVDGIVDLFKKHNKKIFGPSQYGAQLEGSKIFSKNFMKKHHVKTANYATFSSYDLAKQHIAKCQFPIVIKADGLAAGKGVVICDNAQTATKTIDEFMNKKIFKSAGCSIVIEDYLVGFETSLICITDGKTIKPFISAMDHKTLQENNQGPNTGGMGAICPNPLFKKSMFDDFSKNIMLPTLEGIKKDNIDFTGFIFFGLMVTNTGCYCLEYNVRMGDPETQSLIPLMDFDFIDLIISCLEQKLDKFDIKWSKNFSCNVVLCSQGYPFHPLINQDITFHQNNNVIVFWAGATKKEEKIVTSGGRVASIVAIGNDINKAIKTTYDNINTIDFNGKQYRKDIGGQASE